MKHKTLQEIKDDGLRAQGWKEGIGIGLAVGVAVALIISLIVLV